MRARNGFVSCCSMLGVFALSAVFAGSALGQTNTMQYSAIGASGVECPNGAADPATSCDWYLDGSGGIVLHSVPQTIYWELLLDAWGAGGFPDDPLTTYQQEIFCDSLDNGTGCIEPAPGLTPNQCNNAGQTFGVDYCNGIDDSNPNFVYSGIGILSAFPNTMCSMQLGTTAGVCDPQTGSGLGALPIIPTQAPSYADGGSVAKYGGQYAANVPASARGIYSIDLHPNNGLTFMRTTGGQNLTPINRVPMQVEITSGACCGIAGQPLQCGDDFLAGECAAAGGGFFPGDVCTGMPNPADDTLDALCPVCETNADCDDGNACTDDICTPGGCVNNDTTPAGQCCNPNTGGLTVIDDGDACTEDVCNAGTGNVSHDPAAAGTACDDGNGCTTADVCDGMNSAANGGCAGDDVNTSMIACTTDDDCPDDTGATCDTDTGFCDCSLTTKLSLNVDGEGEKNCFGAGDDVVVEVAMGAGSEIVTGAQALVVYDTTCLSNPVVGAGDPFTMPFYTEIDEAAGTVFLATGVAFGDPGTQGPATIATITFTKNDVCGECEVCFADNNPQNTILTNNEGNRVPIETNCSKSFELAGELELNVPDNVSVNPQCDFPTAIIDQDPVTASSSCPDDTVTVDCSGSHRDLQDIPTGIDVDHLINGGEFPQGNSTFTCVASTNCGETDEKSWTVTVSDRHTLDVVVQLEPPTISGSFDRCICFEFFADCVQGPIDWCETLTFGPPYDFPGHATIEGLKVPKGQFACITAKDPLHTLRSTADIDCDADTGNLSAVFKGDPFFGGNWLPGGNLDCNKDAPGTSPDTIDILDWGVLFSQWTDNLDPNTPCDGANPPATELHADINGDGLVNGTDVAYIQRNFLEASKDSCCPDGGAAAAPQPVTSITVKELRALGLGDLAAGDLNGDGVLDVADMNAYQQGQVPSVRPKNGSRTGSVRSSLGN